jgi:peptidyl-tRNA hydrolase, PTH1 family
VGFSGYFKIDVGDILVAVDDVELPLGVIRLRKGGSPGTHNGLKNISLRVGGEYCRLRLGVGGRESGADRPAQDLASHVLSRFSEQEEEALKGRVDAAVEACLLWAQKGIDAAMNKFNVADKKKKSDEK